MANDYRGLLSGSYWGGIEVTRKPTIVTFSFAPTSAPPAYIATLDDPALTAAALASYTEFSTTEQAMARAALADWADACGLVFIEVAAGQGDIAFGKLDFSGTGYDGAGGIGYRPFGEWDFASYPYFKSDLDAAGDVLMNADVPIAYGTLLHEIGHAIGLKHPTGPVTNYAAWPAVTHAVWTIDDPARTIMSQQPGGTGHLTNVDIQAVRVIYGTAAQDPRHSWDAATQTLVQTGTTGDNAIRGSSVIDRIAGNDGDDRLFGLAGDDVLLGGAGMDQLDGGGGSDRLVGGAGDDVYFVDSQLDRIVELAGGGNDFVVSSVDITLAAEVEQLQLRGTAILSGYGNALDNNLYGSDGGSILGGGGGADYIVGGIRTDQLRGDAGGDSIFGGDGNDVLTGGADGDYMVGGAGADRFLMLGIADFGAGDFGTGGAVDFIGDFSTAQRDRIDLRPIDADPVATGDQAFVFLGSAAFTGGAAAEVRVFDLGGSDLRVEVDTDRDLIADGYFVVQAPAGLSAVDFLL